MSGGAFDYAYSKADSFAYELGNKLDEFDKVDDWGGKPNSFSTEVLAKLREIQAITANTAKLMHEVEWLYSGDTGENTFMRRVGDIKASKLDGL